MVEVQPGRSHAFFRHASPGCITPAFAAAVLAAHHHDPAFVPRAPSMDAATAAATRATLVSSTQISDTPGTVPGPPRAARYDTSKRKTGPPALCTLLKPLKP